MYIVSMVVCRYGYFTSSHEYPLKLFSNHHGHPVVCQELFWTVESEAIIISITLIVAETPKRPIHLQRARSDNRRQTQQAPHLYVPQIILQRASKLPTFLEVHNCVIRETRDLWNSHSKHGKVIFFIIPI